MRAHRPGGGWQINEFCIFNYHRRILSEDQTMNIKKMATIAVLLSCIARPTIAQAPPQWHDDLVDHMAGALQLEGSALGKPAHPEVTTERVLSHQCLRLHERSS